ncbi:nicotinate-nucleotide--dimethylbenzimidazole phosphoribosyltransferase [Alteribacter populi]|uniref:nicotinate-nucleotide--dimethylbenzimidazole phosphoribosyltransferase n=1 Tax=Alteribacter populi TaxID=2011011 RepID=UPI0018E27536|nr:nicotinate-nucleotide--dimethylbenzimidazole phosphoribosyltransferase [Alteribacter populi]
MQKKVGNGILLKIIDEIPPVDKDAGNDIRSYLNTLTKPQGSLGRLEELVIQLGEITGSRFPEVSPPGIIVFAADHGIVSEGVSAYPQEVTSQMVDNFLHGGAAINVLAKQIGAKLEIVDIGVASTIETEGVISRKVRNGTENFLKKDAMSKEEALTAIGAGIEISEQFIDDGVKYLILGEMGIGNTTSSSAILAALSQVDIHEVVDAGAGISAEQMIHKQRIIKQAIFNRNPNPEDPLDVLVKVGGLEIAGKVGAILGAAIHRKPVLIDGFISTVAALLAYKLSPHVKDYMIIGHQSEERGHKLALDMLQMKPILNLNLRLGEGTGAALAFPILESSTKILKEMATFSSAGVAGAKQPSE